MKQLQAEVTEEPSLLNKKRSLKDMNKMVESLDRKKFQMLRSFIATPMDFDTIGSRQKILDDVISSSGSGSSINTFKNAP